MSMYQRSTVTVAPARMFQSRITVVGWIIVVLFSGISYRLFSKSILEHESYIARASDQHMIREDLPSRRGTIFVHDIQGELFPAATNARMYDVSIIPARITDAKGLSAALASTLGLDENEVYTKASSKKPYIPPLKRRVDKATVDKLLALSYKGLSITPADARYYPENEFADQLLGYVSFQGAGTYGLESRYDDALQGKDGTLMGQKDTYGRLVSITGQVKPESGSDLVLSIDHTIQYLADTTLKQAMDLYGAGGGSIIVTDPNTGAILAMSNQPGFDPNKYNEVPTDQASRFSNPAISGAYEPGSIMKPVVMATAINEGKLEPDTRSTFSNYVTVQGYQIHTALDKAFGDESMTQVLENSDNVGMVWVASHFEYQTMYDAFKRFGFGAPTGIDLPSEASGSILPIKNWRDISRATMSFGQGISVTPIQMAMAWGSIVNGGKLMKPYVVEKMIRSNGDIVQTKPTEVRETVSKETADKVRLMLQSVVDNGQSKKAQIAGYAIGGKTGTAQIADPKGGYYEDQWNHSFMGFFPVENPKYLVLVKLDHPTSYKFADGTALPVFSVMAKGIISYAELEPTR